MNESNKTNHFGVFTRRRSRRMRSKCLVPTCMYISYHGGIHIHVFPRQRDTCWPYQAQCFRLRKLDAQTRSAGVVQHKDKDKESVYDMEIR